MKLHGASRGISLGTIILFAASGEEIDPERLILLQQYS